MGRCFVNAWTMPSSTSIRCVGPLHSHSIGVAKRAFLAAWLAGVVAGGSWWTL